MNFKPKVKYVNLTWTGTTALAFSKAFDYVEVTSEIPQGTDEGERIGRQIFAKNLYIKGTIRVHDPVANQDADNIRLAVIRDTQSQDVPAEGELFFDTTVQNISWWNRDYKERFKILYDKNFAMAATIFINNNIRTFQTQQVHSTATDNTITTFEGKAWAGGTPGDQRIETHKGLAWGTLTGYNQSYVKGNIGANNSDVFGTPNRAVYVQNPGVNALALTTTNAANNGIWTTVATRHKDADDTVINNDLKWKNQDDTAEVNSVVTYSVESDGDAIPFDNTNITVAIGSPSIKEISIKLPIREIITFEADLPAPPPDPPISIAVTNAIYILTAGNLLSGSEWEMDLNVLLTYYDV